MSNLKVSVVFDAQNGQFKTVVNDNKQSIAQLGNSTQHTAGQTRQFSQSLDNSNIKLATTDKLALSAGRAISGMAAGFGVSFLLSEVSQTTRTFQTLKATLETATGSKEKAADAFERLQIFAAKTPFSVEESTQAFIKLKNLGLDPTEAALNSYGNTASAMGKSLDQFIEAVADASVSEFERLKEFGIKSKNQGDTIAFTFRKMTTEVANNAEAIEKYLQGLGNNEFAGAMERQAASYDGSLSNMGDSWDSLINKISENGVGDAMESSVRGVTANLDLLGQHTDEIITIFQIGLVVATGHAVSAIYNKTAATAKDIITSRAAALTTIAQTKSEIQLATSARATAITSAEAVAADTRLIAARTALTAATTRLSIASKGLAFLGGLPGILTLAAFGMYSFASSTGDAADEVSRLNKESEKLNPFANYNLSQATAGLQFFKNQLEVAVNKADEARVRLNNPFFKNKAEGKIGVVEKADAEVEQLTEKVRLLQSVLDKLNKSDTSTKPVKQDSKALDAFQQQEQSLIKQLALLGQTTELAKVEYEVSLGKYKDLLPAQKAALTNLAKDLDLKNQSLEADKLATNQAQQLSQASDSYAATLQRKTQLVGDTSEVARLNFEIEHGSLKGITEELEKQLMLMAEKADRAQADADAQLPFWEQMRKHIADTSQDFDVMWGNSFNNFAQGMGNAVAEAVMEGENFGDTMKKIARSAIKQVISGLVEIGIKRLALAAIEQTIGASGSASTIALAATTGTTIATSMAPAATMASLASFGANSVPAMAGMTATFALAEGLSLAGMAHDGIDNVPREGTWLLDKGERVVDSRTNSDLKQALKGDSMSGGNVTVNLIEDASQAGKVNQEKGINGEDVIRIFVANIRQGGDASDAIENTYRLQRTGS